MRSSTVSGFAILAATSLLTQDALAIPYDRRAAEAGNAVIVATVTQQAGGAIPSAPITPIKNEPEKPNSYPDSEPHSGAPTPSSSSSKKRGLAYNDASLLKSFLGPNSKAGWCYNWDSTPGSIPSGLEFVPMLHDFRPEKLSSWVSNANKALSSGATHLQFINEPDMSADPSVGGCDTSPGDAADGYVKHMMPFKEKAKIGSPAVSNGEKQPGTEKPAGIAYLKEFFKKCADCQFDFLPFHWYGTEAGAFKKHVQDMSNLAKGVKGNPKLWITEFGLNGGNPESISAFLNEVMPWLDSQDYVERYAYQWVADKFLVTGTLPNKAGKTFAGIS